MSGFSNKMLRLNKTNILISIEMFILGAATTLVYTSMTFLSQISGISESMSWVIIAAYALGMVITTLLTGKIVDCFDKRAVIICSLLTLCVGDTIIAFADRRYAVLAGIILSGWGFSSSESVSSAFLTDINAEKAAKWVNLSQIFFCMGAVITPTLSAWLTNKNHIDFSVLFGITAATALLAAVMLVLTYTEKGALHGSIFCDFYKENERFNQFTLLISRKFRILCAEAFLYLCVETMGASYIKIMLMESGCSETQSSLAASLFWALMVCGRLIGCTQSGNENKSIRFFSLISVAACVLLATARGYITLTLSAALLGFGCGPIWSMIFVLGSKEYPQKSGAAFTVMMLFTDIAIMISPAAYAGFVNNLHITFALCAITSLLILILNHCAETIP